MTVGGASLAAGLLLAGLISSGYGMALVWARARPLARRASELALQLPPLDDGPGGRRPDRALALAALVNGWGRPLWRRVPNLSLKLARAGYRRPEARLLFGAAAVAALPLSAGLGALVGAWAWPGVSSLMGLAGGAILGAMAPWAWVENRARRRLEAIRDGLADLLDLLVICLEAGLSLDPALVRVARELAPFRAELADEIGYTAVELGLLPERADALANLERRVPLPEVRSLVTALVQTERYGTPLAAALRVLAAEVRAATLLRLEERVARLPALLTLPLVAFILPPLFIVLIGPVILQVLAL